MDKKPTLKLTKTPPPTTEAPAKTTTFDISNKLVQRMAALGHNDMRQYIHGALQHRIQCDESRAAKKAKTAALQEGLPATPEPTMRHVIGE